MNIFMLFCWFCKIASTLLVLTKILYRLKYFYAWPNFYRFIISKSFQISIKFSIWLDHLTKIDNYCLFLNLNFKSETEGTHRAAFATLCVKLHATFKYIYVPTKLFSCALCRCQWVDNLQTFRFWIWYIIVGSRLFQRCMANE